MFRDEDDWIREEEGMNGQERSQRNSTVCGEEHTFWVRIRAPIPSEKKFGRGLMTGLTGDRHSVHISSLTPLWEKKVEAHWSRALPAILSGLDSVGSRESEKVWDGRSELGNLSLPQHYKNSHRFLLIGLHC